MSFQSASVMYGIYKIREIRNGSPNVCELITNSILYWIIEIGGSLVVERSQLRGSLANDAKNIVMKLITLGKRELPIAHLSSVTDYGPSYLFREYPASNIRA